VRTCDAAVAVLRETNNPAVMWGDEGLCHLIADRAQLRTSGRAWKTSDAVLANLARCHDGLVAGTTTCHGKRRVRIFWLPEHAPKWALERAKEKKDEDEGEEEEKPSVLQVAAKALLRDGLAIIGPSDVSVNDERKVLLVGSRLPLGDVSSTIASALSRGSRYVEFISYVYMWPNGDLDIETTNASFNRRTDLNPAVERALKPLLEAHVKKILTTLKNAKLAPRVHRIGPAAVPLPCDSTYYLARFEDVHDPTAEIWPGGLLRCGRHRGHDDDHRAVYRKPKPGMFGDGSGLVWPNAGPMWIVKSLVRNRK
jgi:hypothetical protein